MKRVAPLRPARQVAAALALLLCGCEIFGTRHAGGGSEAGNAIVAGRLTDASGRPMEGVTVQAWRVDADPLSDIASAPCEHIRSDAEGRFLLHCRDTSAIHLSGIHPERRTAFLINGIHPIPGREIALPDAAMRPPGRLRVPLPESGAAPGSHVYLAGTPWYKRVDSAALAAGSVLLDTVPSGIVASVRMAAPDTSPYQVLAADVAVASAQLTTISPYGNWARSLGFRLDMASVGALGSDQYSFPLLVRLAAADFDFAQARGHGEDIRFAKSDGAPLPFEIDSWDSAGSNAAIWLRIDTVFADNRGQTVTMFWGNPQAQAARPARPIFDTAAGFAGVWHLGEERDSSHTPGVYRDATRGGADGDDYITTESLAGSIGGGLNLLGRMWVEVPEPPLRLLATQSLTITAWVRCDSLDDSGSVLVNLEEGYRLRLWPDSTVRFGFQDGDMAVSAGSAALPIGDGTWHHIAAVFDGATSGIYVDGKPGPRIPAAGPIRYPVSEWRRLYLGNFSEDSPGFRENRLALDEVQISRVARAPGWVALAYANQRPGPGIPVLTRVRP